MATVPAGEPTSSPGTASARVVDALLKLTVAGGAVLLGSFGGAIAAAPLTIWGLVVVIVTNRLRRPWRVAASIVAALTVAEVVWAAVYLLAGEPQPAIWLVPLLAGAGVLALASWTVLRLRRD